MGQRAAARTSHRDGPAPATLTRRRWLLGAAAACCWPALAPTTPARASTPFPPLFGTREIKSRDLKPFPKWTGTLARYFDERKLRANPCGGAEIDACHLQQWEAFLEGIDGTSPEVQLDLVNARMNRKDYIIDPRNYGVKDYWATPAQFFRRNGDCEDYAIAKFMSLRALGWKNDAMRIVVVQDLNLGVAHAILVVYRDGAAMVLDNQIQVVIDADRITHYRPYYSINETAWWLHK